MCSILFPFLAVIASFHQAFAAPTPSSPSPLTLVKRSCGQWRSGPASSFPPQSSWLDFETLFNLNKANILSTGNTGEDVGRMWNAINSAAGSTGVDQRVILAIILQESSGNVGVQCTGVGYGLECCGLMQAIGSPSYVGQHGLSQDSINDMINAGVNHFKGNLAQQGDADDATTIYQALRLYNSGSLDASNLSDGLGATDSYVSDVANRLLGVVC